MSVFPMFVEKNLPLLFMICLLWGIGVFIVLYLIYRAKGKPVPRVPPEQILFSERGASGFSHKNLLCKLGGARHCLNVVLGHDVLTVSVAFPFSLMDAAGTFDLHHTIPTARITKIAPGKQDTVIVAFQTDAGEQKRLELTLSRDKEFLEKAASLGNLRPRENPSVPC
ncbi:MAG: hypothetical protein FD174_1074 [Geobacteraceae bacterium]|nr:MAG: hypothetical protein FD174_1074 [Geobacteraceae bacterium]